MYQRYPEYEVFYTDIDQEIELFDDLLREVQIDLLEWFNAKKPFRRR